MSKVVIVLTVIVALAWMACSFRYPFEYMLRPSHIGTDVDQHGSAILAAIGRLGITNSIG